MFERPPTGEEAVLVRVRLSDSASAGQEAEFDELVHSAGARAVARLDAQRDSPDPRYFVGAGKAEQIRDTVLQTGAQVVIFDQPLAPAQERNLERLVQCRVLDRITLILDIFAQRASTFEGKLQVELAQLKHLSTRLVRGWTHLERQKGGIGLRGPGEKQLETDRRLLNERIKIINRRLHGVGTRRELSRRSRRKSQVPVISLVGYTNAGKSTLFNQLTGAQIYAADRLFATLDPTLRAVTLPGLGDAVLVDTVGFIRDLPPDLVAAFRATLEETRQAAVLLHVIDAGADDLADKRGQVNEVLRRIGAERVPQLEVYNKIDRVPQSGAVNGFPAQAHIDRDASGRPVRVWVSARSGEGMALLKEAVAELLESGLVRRRVRIPAGDGRLRALLFELGAVVSEQVVANGDSLLDIAATQGAFERLCRNEGLGDCVTLDAAGG